MKRRRPETNLELVDVGRVLQGRYDEVGSLYERVDYGGEAGPMRLSRHNRQPTPTPDQRIGEPTRTEIRRVHRPRGNGTKRCSGEDDQVGRNIEVVGAPDDKVSIAGEE